MRRYFLSDTWDSLSESAQQCIISADRIFSSDSGRRAGVFNELRLALEAILEEVLWNPFHKWLQGKALKDFSALAVAKDERRFGTFLGQMLEQLWGNDAFKRFVEESFSPQEGQFILRLRRPLSELLAKRNPSEHPQQGRRPFTEEDVRMAYGQCLGIGQEGIIPRLLQIKREAMRQRK